jgi:uncharacterized protein YacL
MSAEFIIRLIGMIVFTVFGVAWGTTIGRAANATSERVFTIEQYAFTIGLVGALTGLILTPLLTIRPLRSIRALLGRISAQSLFASLLGLVVGLVIAALLAFPISLLPAPFGQVLPFVGVLIFCYFGVAIFVTRQNDMFSMLTALNKSASNSGTPSEGSAAGWADARTILLDTSVIIDGRIADIARTGFLPGSLLIPRFVLNELQFIADSSDSLRRQRGRRGMEVLAQLQKEPGIPVRISDIVLKVCARWMTSWSSWRARCAVRC